MSSCPNLVALWCIPTAPPKKKTNKHLNGQKLRHQITNHSLALSPINASPLPSLMQFLMINFHNEKANCWTCLMLKHCYSHYIDTINIIIIIMMITIIVHYVLTHTHTQTHIYIYIYIYTVYILYIYIYINIYIYIYIDVPSLSIVWHSGTILALFSIQAAPHRPVWCWRGLIRPRWWPATGDPIDAGW